MALKNKDRLNCLETLGLKENATEDDIKRAYKNLALQHHPDKNPDNPQATEVFQEISESYYLLTTKYAKDRRKKIHMCSNCGDLHYVDSDDDEFYEDDDDYFEDDDYYYDNLPCDDDDDSVLWFFGRLFYDVFSDFVFARRFQSSKKATHWSAEEEEEDTFFNSIFKKYRPPQDMELTEEDLKKFHSYDEWLKSRDPSKRHNHRTRKGKKRALNRVPEKPAPLSKKQLLAEQRKREQEMKEIGQTILPKLEKKTKKSSENIAQLDKVTTEDNTEEVENQHKENFQRRVQETEKLQLIEAQERQKNKRQQRKNMKEKKKQLRLEAEKLLQEKKFSKPPPEREKTELEMHEEKQIFLFGKKDVNSSKVPNDVKKSKDRETKSLLLGKHFGGVDKLSASSNTQSSVATENSDHNSNTITKTTGQKQMEETLTKRGKSRVPLSPPIPPTQQRPLTVKPVQGDSQTDPEVKSSLLQKHLQEFSDLMKVQPQRHTEQQLRAERIRQKEEQQVLHQQELDSLRSKHTEQFVPVPPSATNGEDNKPEGGEEDCVQEEFERMRKEHLRKQQELERKRNEEEVQELKTYRKKQKWKELKIEAAPLKWFEKEDPEIRAPPPKIPEPAAPSVNVWQQRNLRQQQLNSLAPQTPQEEEQILKQVLLLSQRTAAQEEEQRRYWESMTSKNFIPEQLQKSKNQQPAKSSGKDSAQKREPSETQFQMTQKKEPAETHSQMTQKRGPAATDSQMTQKREPVETRSQIESSRPKTAPQMKLEPTKSAYTNNIWDVAASKTVKAPPPGEQFRSPDKEEAPKRPVLTTNFANLIPPPRIQVKRQAVSGKESWDDDGQFLCVSNKLPTTAQDCSRWQTNARILVSASEDSQTTDQAANQKQANSSSVSNVTQSNQKQANSSSISHVTQANQKQANGSSVGHSTQSSKLTPGMDENHNDISMTITDDKRERLKDTKTLSDNGVIKQSEVKDFINHDKWPGEQTEFSQRTQNPLKMARAPQSTPYPSLDNTSPGQISVNHKGDVGQGTRSQTGVPYMHQMVDDYWNVATKRDAHPAEGGDAQKPPKDKTPADSEERAKHLLASLQQKAYQMSGESWETSNIGQDYWKVSPETSYKVNTHSSPEIFISPENVKKDVQTDNVTSKEEKELNRMPPVVPIVQSKDVQTKAMSHVVSQSEGSWEEETSVHPIASSLTDSSVKPLTKALSQIAGVPQKEKKPDTVPIKKVSNMLNKMAKFGINPNPIKKDKTDEGKVEKPISQESQQKRPGYKQRPMKTVAKPIKTLTDPLSPENPSGKSEREGEWENELIQHTPVMVNNASTTSTREKPVVSEESRKKFPEIGITSGERENSTPPGSSKVDNSWRNLGAAVNQTTDRAMTEDWESELISIPAPPSTTEAENFFKEKIRNVRKEPVEHRLPVLKNLTKQVDTPTSDSSSELPTPNPSANSEPVKEIRTDQAKGGSIEQGTSEPGPLHLTPDSGFIQSVSDSLPTITAPLASESPMTAPPTLPPPKLPAPSNHSSRPDMEQNPTPPPPNLPAPSTTGTLPVFPQASGETAELDAAGLSNLSPLGLPLTLPPHLVQAYLQYLVMASNTPGGGLGLLPGLPLLPGIAPLMSLGLPNPLLPNPLLSLNMMGLPGQTMVNPSLNQPPAQGNSPTNPPHLENLNNPPTQGQSQMETQEVGMRGQGQSSSPSLDPGSRSLDFLQNNILPQQNESADRKHNVENISQGGRTCAQPSDSESWETELTGSAGSYGNLRRPDLQQLERRIRPSPVSVDQLQFGEEITAEKLNQVPNFSAPKERTSTAHRSTKSITENLSMEQGGAPVKEKRAGFGRVGVSQRGVSVTPRPPETKLPESLVKRKEQTRTVQALIERVLQENKGRDTADLVPDVNRI